MTTQDEEEQLKMGIIPSAYDTTGSVLVCDARGAAPIAMLALAMGAIG